MIKKARTIGFPRMKQEAGEKRIFLPEFINQLLALGFVICIEEGYGSRLGFSEELYMLGDPRVRMCSREECFAQDYVMILRAPKNEDFDLIKPGACLISMLHFPTRPKRVRLLKQKKINAISLDSITDDTNLRLIENMKAVAWNGLEAAFDIFEARSGTLLRKDNTPWKTLILGTGMVGKHAVAAATKLGNTERYNDHIRENGAGNIATGVGRATTSKPGLMKQLFQETDILVDSAYRRDTSQPIVPNEWISWLPEHAVIVDLAVDPYTLDANPPVVRGIEGIPQGNLDQYVFEPDDPNWERTVPEVIPSKHRRTTVTCYSWPGIHPETCMRHYARQLLPLMEVLAKKDYDKLSPHGNYFERALYRGTLKAFLNIAKDLP